jgi:hypothetical protein
LAWLKTLQAAEELMSFTYIKSALRTFYELVIFDAPKVILLVRKVPSFTYVLLLITNNRNLAFPAYLFI